MKRLGHDLKLALDVVGYKLLQILACPLAETLALRTGQLVLGFQTDQNDVLLLVLYFSGELSKTVQVDQPLVFVFDIVGRGEVEFAVSSLYVH